MKTLHNILPILCLSATVLSAQAQNLKTEITVDRTVVPVEREAVRLGALNPQLVSTPVNHRQLTPADYTSTVGLTRSASVLEPAAYGDTLAISPYRGYASLGYFPVFNLGASAGYRFIDKSKTRLGAWMQYDGCSYDSNEDAVTGKYKNNTVTVGARFDQRIGRRTSFSASADYTYSNVGLPDVFKSNKQSANDFSLKLALWSRSNSVAYHLNGAFSHFGYTKDVFLNIPLDAFALPSYTAYSPIKPVSQNRFTFKGGLAYLGSSATPRAGVELSLDFLSRNNGLDYTELKYQGSDVTYKSFDENVAKTLGVVSLTPYVNIGSDNVHGRIGAKIEISTGGAGKKFHIAPAVMLDWNAASKLALYALIDGGEHLNSLASLYNYCPFMPGCWQYQRSHIPVNAEVGINVGPISGFSAKLFGGFAKANDWLMPQFTNIMGASGRYFNGVNYGLYDLKSWHAGIKLEYQWQSLLKVHASAEAAPNKADKSYYLWRDRAKYVLNAGIDLTPVEALKIGFGYELRADRRNYSYLSNGTTEAIDIEDFSNLWLRVSYDINSQFTVFARGENLLNKRCMLVTDIEAQGTKGLVGVSYKF